MYPCSTSLTPDSFWGEKDDLSSAWRSCRWLCAPVCPAPCTGRRPVSCQKAAGPPPVSRVFKSPPRSKKRGELAWGGRLSRTAENSGPDPMPIKMNGKAPTSCGGTWQRAPPRAAHPQGSSMHPHSEKARGCSSHLCPSLGARPLGQGCPFLLERAPPGPVPT